MHWPRALAQMPLIRRKAIIFQRNPRFIPGAPTAILEISRQRWSFHAIHEFGGFSDSVDAGGHGMGATDAGHSYF
jgi:hypothetical protein